MIVRPKGDISMSHIEVYNMLDFTEDEIIHIVMGDNTTDEYYFGEIGSNSRDKLKEDSLPTILSDFEFSMMFNSDFSPMHSFFKNMDESFVEKLIKHLVVDKLDGDDYKMYKLLVMNYKKYI